MAEENMLEVFRRMFTSPPHLMDEPDGPRCRCRRPSTYESGWCGQCGTCECPVDKNFRIVPSHECPEHGLDLA